MEKVTYIQGRCCWGTVIHKEHHEIMFYTKREKKELKQIIDNMASQILDDINEEVCVEVYQIDFKRTFRGKKYLYEGAINIDDILDKYLL
jgi:hypothetical protein